MENTKNTGNTENTGKYGPEKSQYLDTFHAVMLFHKALRSLPICIFNSILSLNVNITSVHVHIIKRKSKENKITIIKIVTIITKDNDNNSCVTFHNIKESFKKTHKNNCWSLPHTSFLQRLSLFEQL